VCFYYGVCPSKLNNSLYYPWLQLILPLENWEINSQTSFSNYMHSFPNGYEKHMIVGITEIPIYSSEWRQLLRILYDTPFLAESWASSPCQILPCNEWSWFNHVSSRYKNRRLSPKTLRLCILLKHFTWVAMISPLPNRKSWPSLDIPYLEPTFFSNWNTDAKEPLQLILSLTEWGSLQLENFPHHKIQIQPHIIHLHLWHILVHYNSSLETYMLPWFLSLTANMWHCMHTHIACHIPTFREIYFHTFMRYRLLQKLYTMKIIFLLCPRINLNLLAAESLALGSLTDKAKHNRSLKIAVQGLVFKAHPLYILTKY
jgi:hypothetical protein